MNTDTPSQPTLQAAAQAVLDRWDSPRWKWQSQSPTADLMADLRKALAASPQPTATQPVASEFDVRRILLDIVPGDGDGLEVYAKSAQDVERKLTEMGQRIEDLESATPTQAEAMVAAERNRWRAAIAPEIPADMKDWHENSPDEWPEVAAAVLRSRREDAEMAWGMLAEWREREKKLMRWKPIARSAPESVGRPVARRTA